MTIEEMARAYAEGYNKEYQQIAYDSFLCGYDAKCGIEFSEGLEKAAIAQYPKVWRKYPKDGIIRSEEYYDANEDRRNAFIVGAKWQKDKILKLIEARISEIIGDAQPNPILRLELQGVIDKIK